MSVSLTRLNSQRLQYCTRISPAFSTVPGTCQSSVGICWVNRTHQESMPGTSARVCVGGHPKLEWHWANKQMCSLRPWCVVPPVLASPGSSALDAGSGCQGTALQTVQHNEESQPCLDPHQPRGHWVSCPVQHHPCKYTSISSSTDSLGQDVGRTT